MSAQRTLLSAEGEVATAGQVRALGVQAPWAARSLPTEEQQCGVPEAEATVWPSGVTVHTWTHTFLDQGAWHGELWGERERRFHKHRVTCGRKL